MVIQLQSLKIGIRSCAAQKVPQNVQGSHASTRLKTGGELRSCAIFLLCVLCKLFPSAQQSLASLATKQTDFHFPMKELLRGDLGRVLGKHLQLQLTDRRSALRTT